MYYATEKARESTAGGQIQWVCARRIRLGGASQASRTLVRITDLLHQRTSRVAVQRWIRYRIDLDGTPPQTAEVELTPLTEHIIARLKAHPDAALPDLRSGLEFWDAGLRDGYVWLADDQPLCMQWLLTERDNVALSQLPFWGNMYPPLSPGLGQVEKLWTFSGTRKKGVATLFEYALFEQARRRGIKTLLTHIGEGNVAARGWADKTGWEAFGTIDRYSFDLPRIRDMDSTICVHSVGPVSTL